MAVFKPKFITFDCYGTLINFDMAGAASRCFADRVSPAEMSAFTTDFYRYRFDEVLGAWKPYYDVVSDALQRTCKSGVWPGSRKTAIISTKIVKLGLHIPMFLPDLPKSLTKSL